MNKKLELLNKHKTSIINDKITLKNNKQNKRYPEMRKDICTYLLQPSSGLYLGSSFFTW